MSTLRSLNHYLYSAIVESMLCKSVIVKDLYGLCLDPSLGNIYTVYVTYTIYRCVQCAELEARDHLL